MFNWYLSNILRGRYNINLLKKYLKKKIRLLEINNQDIVMGLLEEIGKQIIDEEQKGNKKGIIYESTLKRKLGMSPLEKLPEELFSFNILTKNKLENGNAIGFYFTKLRDFIIAIYSLKLPEVSSSKFKKILSKLNNGPVGRSVISWYIPYSDNDQKEIMFKYKKSQALKLVNDYETLLKENFNNIKDRFEPKTNGEIGIAITTNKTPFIDAYGFRKINNNQKKVITVDIDNKREKFFEKGVRLITYYSRNVNKDGIFEKIILKQLEIIIKNGLLNESCNINLLKEKVLSLSYYYGDKLNIKKPNDRFLPRYEHILPIDLNEIKERIRFFNAKYYYKQEQFESLKDKGEVEVINTGDGTLVKYNDSIFDYESIEKKAKKAIKENIKIPFPRTSGDFPPYILLYNYINKLQENDIHVINSPILPSPDIPINQINQKIKKIGGKTNYIPNITNVQYSNEQLKKYFKKFFQVFIKEYNKIIEFNFPTLKNYFKLFIDQPVEIIIEINRNKLDGWSLCYGYKINSSLTQNKFEVIINPSKSKFSDKYKDKNIRKVHYTTINKALIADIYTKNYSLSNEFNVRDADEACVIRDWIYRKIEEEFKSIKNELEFSNQINS